MKQSDISLILNELYSESKLTQEQFAQRLGIDQSNFSKILKGQRTCRGITIDCLSCAMPTIIEH